MSKSILVNAGLASMADSDTPYHVPIGGQLIANTTVAQVEIPIREAGVFSNLFVCVPTNSATITSVITLQKSQVNTAVTVSYTAGQTGIKEDNSNSVTFAATDEANYEVVVPSEAGFKALNISVMSMQFTPTNDSQCITILSTAGSHAFTTASGTRWSHLSGPGETSTTAQNRTKYRIRGTFTARNFYTYVSANARTTDTVYSTQKNGAAGAQSVTYTSTQTGVKEDTTNTDSLAAGDDYQYAVTTLAGTQSITTRIISVHLVSTAGQWIMECSRIAGTIAFGSTRYEGVNGALQSNVSAEANVQVYPRFTFTAKELGSFLETNSIDGDTVITLRDNTGDSALTFIYTTTQTGLKIDTSNTATITSGTDEINYSIVTAGTTGSITMSWLGVMGVTVSGYTITAELGTFTLTGNSASLLANRKLTTVVGTFAFTGSAVGLLKGYTLVAVTGIFTLTGNAAGLILARQFTAATGPFILTGNVANLRRDYTLTTNAGVFSHTGNVTNLIKGRTLTANIGAFTLTGNVVGLISARRLISSVGVFTFTGNAVGILANRILTANVGVFTFTGNAAILTKSGVGAYTIIANVGVFTFNGNAVNLVKGRILIANVGTFTFTGNAVGILAIHKLIVVPGIFILSGKIVNLVYSNPQVIFGLTLANIKLDIVSIGSPELVIMEIRSPVINS